MDLVGAIALVEDWADHRLFFHAMPAVVALFPHLPPGMLEDRAAMTSALSKNAIFKAAPQARQEVLFALDSLNITLVSRPYLLGDVFTLADAAWFLPLWFMRAVRRGSSASCACELVCAYRRIYACRGQ